MLRVADIPVKAGEIVAEKLFDMLKRLGLANNHREGKDTYGIPREYNDYMTYAAKCQADLQRNQAMIPTNTPNWKMR